jgi:hypothetical protein
VTIIGRKTESSENNLKLYNPTQDKGTN